MAKMSEAQEQLKNWLASGKATPEQIKQLLPIVKKLSSVKGIEKALFSEDETDTEQSAELLAMACDIEKEAAAAEEIKSALLERLTTSAAKDSGQSVTDQSLLTKMLLKSADTGALTLGKQKGIEKQGRAQIEGGRLTLIEYNILRSIVSYQLDNEAMTEKEITLSASQIYNKMRRGKGSRKVNKSQQEEVHAAMMGLDRWVSYWLNDDAQQWLNIDEKRLRHRKLLQFGYDDGFINGQHTEYYYTIYNVGLLQEIAYKAGQLERIPQEVLAIQENSGGQWKNWTLSKKRIELRTVLELFFYQLIRSNTIISNKKPYSDIFKACEIGTHREQQKRAKEDIKTILNYWQHLGLFDSWNEYGNGRGIEIHLTKEGAENGLLSSENT